MRKMPSDPSLGKPDPAPLATMGRRSYRAPMVTAPGGQVIRRAMLALASFCAPLAAQRPVPYPVVPPPEFQRAVARGTRGETGEPGPRYWQQWARYHIEASLDPDAKRLAGRERVVYHNRSPDTLGVLYLHLYQNLHAPGVPRNEPAEVTGGVRLDAVTANGQPLTATSARPGYRVDGTVMRLVPPRPVPPGDSIVLELTWEFRVPQQGAGRMGWNGDNMFFLAYWYPRLAVYDDVVGWQVDPYLSTAEFYDGFGDYHFAVDVPEGWVVVATGELVNPGDVLPDAIAARLRRAEQSDQVISILGPGDLGPGKATRTSATGRLTWRYRAERVRDVAFAATSASLWDAARTPVGDRDGDGAADHARVDALYRAPATLWKHAARYAQHALSHHARYTGLPYAWSHMSAVEGGGILSGGMEFPMMTLIDDYRGRSDSALYYVVAHELGHMWVPMMVGTDERRYGWMDEGTTTFNENHASSEFFPGRNADRGDQTGYLNAARSGYESDLMRWTDYLYPGQNGTASYSKPATVLVALRGLLGDTLFLRAYQAYFRRWAFKQPKPWDFFNTFNHVTGRNLDWFWRSWYYETWTLDQAVTSVTPGPEGTRIVVEDLGWIPMPARLTITLANGEVVRREVPVEEWLNGARSAAITVPRGPLVTRVEIDAEHVFPDLNRENNVWTVR